MPQSVFLMSSHLSGLVREDESSCKHVFFYISLSCFPTVKDTCNYNFSVSSPLRACVYLLYLCGLRALYVSQGLSISWSGDDKDTDLEWQLSFEGRNGDTSCVVLFHINFLQSKVKKKQLHLV
jgi:hypothetical protein